MQSKALYGDGVDEELVSCILPSVNITEACKEYLPQLCKSFKVRDTSFNELICS